MSTLKILGKEMNQRDIQVVLDDFQAFIAGMDIESVRRHALVSYFDTIKPALSAQVLDNILYLEGMQAKACEWARHELILVEAKAICQMKYMELEPAIFDNFNKLGEFIVRQFMKRNELTRDAVSYELELTDAE